jgi:PAS domain S-box-containing protein
MTKQKESLRDISGNNKSGGSIAGGEVLYKTLIQHSPNLILIHHENKIVFANDSIVRLLGFTKQTVINRALEDLFTTVNSRKNKTEVQEIFKDTSQAEHEVRTKDAGGLLKEFLIRSNLIRYRGKKAFLSILTDITDLKNMEKYVISRVMETEELERKRFSADLHDDLGPTLSSIRLRLGLLESLSDPDAIATEVKICNDLLMEVITKVRMISQNLTPRLIEDYGIHVAIDDLCNRMRNIASITIEFISDIRGLRFPKNVELHYYRIASELLNNSIKYSNASLISIKAFYSNKTLKLEYTDNGVGYTVDEALQKSTGMGIHNILDRVNLIDARIAFTNKYGKMEVRVTKNVIPDSSGEAQS